MRSIIFYHTAGGKSPIEDFLDSLSPKAVAKILWVLRLVKQLDQIPKEYFKKLKNKDDLWEVRIGHGNNEYRILGFWWNKQFIVLTNGFAKKTRKTPKQEIKLASNRKQDYLTRMANG